MCVASVFDQSAYVAFMQLLGACWQAAGPEALVLGTWLIMQRMSTLILAARVWCGCCAARTTVLHL